MLLERPHWASGIFIWPEGEEKVSKRAESERMRWEGQGRQWPWLRGSVLVLLQLDLCTSVRCIQLILVLGATWMCDTGMAMICLHYKMHPHLDSWRLWDKGCGAGVDEKQKQKLGLCSPLSHGQTEGPQVSCLHVSPGSRQQCRNHFKPGFILLTYQCGPGWLWVGSTGLEGRRLGVRS